jgi:serine protease
MKMFKQARRLSSSRHTGLLAGAAALALAGWGCNSSSDPQSEQSGPSETADQVGAAGKDIAPSFFQTGKIEYAPDSVLVRFKEGASSLRLRSLVMESVNGSMEDKNGDGRYDRFTNVDPSGRMAKIDLAKTMSVERAIDLLRNDPAIQYVEPNYIQHAFATPNDPRFNELYGLHNTGQTGGTADADIDAVEAWDNSVGSRSVVVAVIDTGVDYNHPDLAANIWTNPGEIPGNGLDDDANGVIDDVHGFNAITNGGNPLDDNQHGSHCSGTIGGVGSNGVGVAGVNWEVSIMAIKFLSASGSGTTADAIEGIDYAVGRKNAGVNLRVLSNSWGGGGFSQALADSITAANTANMLFVAAAGNAGTNNDTTPSYPASYDIPNVVSVAATDRSDALASFSNFGATSVDLGAPGVNILSTTPSNTYSVFSGTSMATPHVAGVAALVLSANGTLSTAELKAVLLTSGDSKPSLAGKTLTGKRLNAASALAAAGPPVPRFNLSATPASRVISQGQSTTYTADLTAVAGFTGNAAITVTSSPAIVATITASPASVAVPGTSTINVATTTATAPGVYTLTVTATSGTLVKSSTVSLRVRPFGTVESSFPSTDTPVAIPSGPPAGINSIINVAQPITIQEISVDLSITHTWIGDLLVTLRSPSGTLVTLHNRAGGSADNINQTYTYTAEFAGQQSAGAWTLHVDDNFTADTGTLNSWTLRVVGVPAAPSFSLAATPASRTVTQGAAATFDIAATPLGSFTGNIALTATSTPALAGLTVTPASIGVPGTAALSIATSCTTAPGAYAITITGTQGTITKTANVTLTVNPFGTTQVTYASANTPLPITDGNLAGVTSPVTVAEGLALSALTAEVHIAHTFIGDLSVVLIGPNGQTVTLHNRTGGSADNIDQTYTVEGFNGISAAGTWTLKVTDHLIGFAGTLTSWTLRATGSTGPQAPSASFTYAATRLAVQFTDTSTDTGCGGGGIVSRAWAFGDGSTSTAANPSRTYAAPGTYAVSLTVTDTDGLTATTTQNVTVTRPNATLSIERVVRNRATYEFSVDLTWTGLGGTLVDFFRNGLLVDIPNNTGAKRDSFRRYETSFTWKVCEQQATFCTNEVSIVFGSSADSVTVVTKDAEGISTSRVVPIEDAK